MLCAQTVAINYGNSYLTATFPDIFGSLSRLVRLKTNSYHATAIATGTWFFLMCTQIPLCVCNLQLLPQ